MRRTIAQLIEIAGFASITAGVLIILGAGAALMAGGALLALAAVVVERGK